MQAPQSNPTVYQLFISFVRLGCTAFGIPLMIVFIRTMAVDKKCWLDAKAFDEGAAFCRMIPGATSMQAAAYTGLMARRTRGALASFIGYLLLGILGAVIATVAVFPPSFIILAGVVPFYSRLKSSPVFMPAVTGVPASFVGLLFISALRFAAHVRWNALHLFLAGFFFSALFLNAGLPYVFLTVTAIMLL